MRDAKLTRRAARRKAEVLAKPAERGARATSTLLRHAPVTVSPDTENRKDQLHRGSGSPRYRSDNVADVANARVPSLEFLTCAYLGSLFKEKSDGGESYEVQARQLRTTKQNLIKLARGKTVGLQVFYHLAKEMFGGSIDAMSSDARRWWAALDEEKRTVVYRWAEHQEKKRPTTSSKNALRSPGKRGLTLAKSAPSGADSRQSHGKHDAGAGEKSRRPAKKADTD